MFILKYLLSKLKTKRVGSNPLPLFEKPFLRPTPTPAPLAPPPKRIIIEVINN